MWLIRPGWHHGGGRFCVQRRHGSAAAVCLSDLSDDDVRKTGFFQRPGRVCLVAHPT